MSISSEKNALINFVESLTPDELEELLSFGFNDSLESMCQCQLMVLAGNNLTFDAHFGTPLAQAHAIERISIAY